MQKCRVELDEQEYDRKTAWTQKKEVAYNAAVKEEIESIWMDSKKLALALDNHCFCGEQIGLLIKLYIASLRLNQATVKEFLSTFNDEVENMAEYTVFAKWDCGKNSSEC